MNSGTDIVELYEVYKQYCKYTLDKVDIQDLGMYRTVLVSYSRVISGDSHPVSHIRRVFNLLTRVVYQFKNYSVMVRLNSHIITLTDTDMMHAQTRLSSSASQTTPHWNSSFLLRGLVLI